MKACGGHFSYIATTYKIIRVRYYWPSICKDSYAMVRICLPCQQFSRKMIIFGMPLQPISVEKPFT
jgi:hypothetical protein